MARSSPLMSHLDWEADDDKEEVRRGQAGQEGVCRRLEGGLPHHSQDDQDIAAHSEGECEAGNIMSTFVLLIILEAQVYIIPLSPNYLKDHEIIHLTICKQLL